MSDDVMKRLKEVSEGLEGQDPIDPELVVKVLDAIPDALVMIDRTGKILLVNQRTVHLFGYTRRDLVGEKLEMLIPLEARERHVVHRERFFLDPHVRPMGTGIQALKGLQKSGEEFPAEINLGPVVTEAGTYAVAIIRVKHG